LIEQFDYATSAWKVSPFAPWDFRVAPRMVCSDTKIMFINGYSIDSTLLDDVWIIDNNGTSWTKLPLQLAPSFRYAISAPPARSNFGLLVTSDSTLFMFGGLADNSEYNDVFYSSFSNINPNSWTQVNPSGWIKAPWSARGDFGHVVVGGGILIFGGRTSTMRLFNDVWFSALERSKIYEHQWIQQTIAAPWSTRYGMSSWAVASSLVVFTGGVDRYGARVMDVWATATLGRRWTLQTNKPNYKPCLNNVAAWIFDNYMHEYCFDLYEKTNIDSFIYRLHVSDLDIQVRKLRYKYHLNNQFRRIVS
jgi:hypothetical protein